MMLNCHGQQAAVAAMQRQGVPGLQIVWPDKAQVLARYLN